MILAVWIVLIVSLALLIGAWVAYPWWIARIGERFGLDASVQSPAPAVSSPSQRPQISVILATRESDDAIMARVASLRGGDFPAAQMDIVIALDATRRDGADALRRKVGDTAHVVHGELPGKSSALNAGVAASRNSLLLFVDTAQHFAADCVDVLTAELERGQWGAVTGTLAPTSGDALMDRYWRRELAVRRGQASRHSVICVTGCAYLMRRTFWSPMPASLICDDLWSTYSVVLRGGRVGIAPAARVDDPRRFTREQEYGRRLRTMTGLLQFLAWFPGSLNPTRNAMWPHLVMHKLLRVLTPVLAILAGSAALILIAQLSSARLTILLYVALAALVLLGVLYLRDRAAGHRRLASLGFAIRLALMPLRALFQAARRDWDVWRPASNPGTTGAPSSLGS